MAAPYTISFRHYSSGVTIRVVIRQLAAQEKVWNGSTFETYATANLNTYAITMTELGSASKLYVGNMPATLPAGLYLVEAYERAGGTLVESDPLVGSPTIVNWSGTAIVSVSGSAVNNSFTFSVTNSAVRAQFAIYWRGAGFPIDFYADPPTAVDESLFRVRIGNPPDDYDEYTPTAPDASIGHLRCTPPIADTVGWDLEDCTVQLWRIGSGDANTGPVFSGKLEVTESLRGP